MDKPTWFTAEPQEVKDQLETAWPGIRINQFRLHLDDRRDDSELAGRLSIWISLSGDKDAVISTGLIGRDDVESLPASGVGRRAGVDLRRSKTGRLSLTVCIYDPPLNHAGPSWARKDDSDQRIMNRLAATLMPSIWQPPKEAA